LPKIQDDGLWYPWDNSNPPIVNEDSKIWALKMGTNRLTALKFLGYNTCNAIYFKNSNDLIEVSVYFREKDPLHNEQL